MPGGIKSETTGAGTAVWHLLWISGALSEALTVSAYDRPTVKVTPGATVMRPVRLLMMKSPWAPARISYVTRPFSPWSASAAVNWEKKGDKK